MADILPSKPRSPGMVDIHVGRWPRVLLMVMMMMMMMIHDCRSDLVGDPFWNGMGHHWEMMMPTLLHRRLDSFRQLSNSDYPRQKKKEVKKNLTPQLFGRGKVRIKIHVRPAAKQVVPASDLVLILFQYHKNWPHSLQIDRLADPALLTCKAQGNSLRRRTLCFQLSEAQRCHAVRSTTVTIVEEQIPLSAEPTALAFVLVF